MPSSFLSFSVKKTITYHTHLLRSTYVLQPFFKKRNIVAKTRTFFKTLQSEMHAYNSFSLQFLVQNISLHASTSTMKAAFANTHTAVSLKLTKDFHLQAPGTHMFSIIFERRGQTHPKHLEK